MWNLIVRKRLPSSILRPLKSKRLLQSTTKVLFSNLYKQKNPYLSQKGGTPEFVKSRIMGDSELATKQEAPAIARPMVWIDCEMTGLDHVNDHIIEICCIITDGDLNIIDEAGYESVIHCDKKIMDAMNEWCIDHHGSSGLTQKVLDSTKTTEQVEEELLAYLKKYIPAERKGVLAGNSVHMDRVFMMREFPKVIDHLFYRIIDVSTIMEVSFRHNPDLASVFPRKKSAHTARSDILESIAQLKWYQDHYLKNGNETRGFVEERRREIALEETVQSVASPTATAEKTAEQTAGNPSGGATDAVAATAKRSSADTGQPLKKQRLD
ncbi:LAQU0S06e04984g1_1 [Lachancea quebecensis]|uniref:LAQU0S06e04984g1_1 n=1 Tax=Lachancea quebecensis TaxID=1654605 RepID=A0A0P1KSL6_9SACH|nr:LAQU0S06e04984g1_1 [Lachancea quebecensis]